MRTVDETADGQGGLQILFHGRRFTRGIFRQQLTMVPTEELSRAYTSHPRLGYTLLVFVWPNKVQREFKHLNIGYLPYQVLHGN